MIPAAMTAEASDSRAKSPHRVVLLSDPHVPGDPTLSHARDRLARAVREVLALAPLPGLVICNGDVAHLIGEAEDYAQFNRIVRPLADAGLPLCCTLGNHDARARFLDHCGRPEGCWDVADKLASVCRTPRLAFVLLDSLDVTDAVPGLLGEAQLAALDRALGASDAAGRPTAIVLHHPPLPDEDPAKPNNLTDFEAFWRVVEGHDHVKAVFYGHLHRWERCERGGVHVVSLPTTAHVFRPDEPQGFVVADLREDGVDLTLHAFDGHAKDRQRVTLTWR